jgi:hypothetical protein
MLRQPPAVGAGVAVAPPAPPKVLFTTYAGLPSNWLSTRTAAPPTSGPRSSHTLLKNRELMILKRPPRTKIAPPPPPPLVSPLALPSMKVRFCKLSCGWSWFWQCEVVHFCAWSQVF